MSGRAQIALAAMWSETIAARSDENLKSSLRWSDRGRLNGPGGLVTRTLVASRANGLMPVVMELAGMPLLDGEETAAFRMALGRVHEALSGPEGSRRAFARSTDLARAAAVVVASTRREATIAWAQAPIAGCGLHGSAIEGLSSYGWAHECAIRPHHNVEGIVDPASAKVRIHPVRSRLDIEGISSVLKDPMMLMRAHSKLEELCQ